MEEQGGETLTGVKERERGFQLRDDTKMAVRDRGVDAEVKGQVPIGF